MAIPPIARRAALRLLAAAATSAGLAGAAIAADAPNRIVIAGGDLTEIVYALGAGDRVIAVDTTSSYPAETAELRRVGYMRRLTAEGVLYMKPDLVLAAADAGPPAALEQLRAANVSIAVAPDRSDLDSVYAKIDFVGATLGLEDKAAALAAEVKSRMDAALARVAEAKTKPKVLFLMSASGSPLAAGAETSADEVIRLAGGVNAVAGSEGYKPLSLEAAVAAKPDVILVPTHAVQGFGGVEGLLKRPELAATPAGQAGRVVVMDGLLLLGFGPRTPQAVLELAQAIHDDLPRE